MNVLDRFKDPELVKGLLAKLDNELDGPLRFMEVCGTHTVAIFQSGLHSLLPDKIVHLSGPGCPVCVTHDAEVAMYLDLAERDDVVIATFGDLMRVPGPGGRNLKAAQAEGARVKVVYSALDAMQLAADNPDDRVVFLGIGFETTAPTIAASIQAAAAKGLKNFQVLSFHKLVPPALKALLGDPELKLEALLLPGHVSAIIGLDPYIMLAEEYGLPATITGFDPVDIISSLLEIVHMRKEERIEVKNMYPRAVSEMGNPKAMAVMNEVFATGDALWRGIGMIPESGLFIADKYEAHDAAKQLGLELKETKPLPGCKCGEVLKGKMTPNACPLFAKACTPANPVGPCMVSTEGSCAAWYKYQPELETA